jgi:hypothetical protein
MRILPLTIAISLAVPANAATISYDCTLAAPQVFSVLEGKASVQSIDGLPSEALKFSLKLSSSSVEVSWPDSLIQMSGKTALFETGPNAGAALFLSSGPCLFTEAACGNMMNYAVQPDKSVNLLITPTALVTDDGTKTRNPFLVSIEGRCLPEKSKQ